MFYAQTSKKYRLLKFCYVPATSIGLNSSQASFLFLFLLLRPFTELLKQTRQAVPLSSLYYLDIYGSISWEYFCFDFALLCQWPLAQLIPAAWAGGVGQCSVYLTQMSVVSSQNLFCWKKQKKIVNQTQPGQAVWASTQSILLRCLCSLTAPKKQTNL